MFTNRNLGGVALFLTGSTWLWLTPEFAGGDDLTSGVMWSVTRVLSLFTVAGFSVATWGLFTRHSWWEAVALASAGLGVLAVVTFVAAAAGGEEPAGTVSWNLFVHVVMLTGLVALLRVPSLERWVDHQVMGG